VAAESGGGGGSSSSGMVGRWSMLSMLATHD
jgi:hypothetical protein